MLEYRIGYGQKSETSGVIMFRFVQYNNEKKDSTWILEFGEVCWGLNNDKTHEWHCVGEDPRQFPNLDQYIQLDLKIYQKLQEILDTKK